MAKQKKVTQNIEVPTIEDEIVIKGELDLTNYKRKIFVADYIDTLQISAYTKAIAKGVYKSHKDPKTINEWQKIVVI